MELDESGRPIYSMNVSKGDFFSLHDQTDCIYLHAGPVVKRFTSDGAVCDLPKDIFHPPYIALKTPQATSMLTIFKNFLEAKILAEGDLFGIAEYGVNQAMLQQRIAYLSGGDSRLTDRTYNFSAKNFVVGLRDDSYDLVGAVATSTDKDTLQDTVERIVKKQIDNPTLHCVPVPISNLFLESVLADVVNCGEPLVSLDKLSGDDVQYWL